MHLPHAQFFALTVPGHLLSCVVDYFNLTWKFGVGIAMVPVTSFLLIELYYYLSEDSFDDDNGGSDSASEGDEGSVSEGDALETKTAKIQVNIVQTASFLTQQSASSSDGILAEMATYTHKSDEMTELVASAKSALSHIGSSVIEPIVDHEQLALADSASLASPADADASSPSSESASQLAAVDQASSDATGSAASSTAQSEAAAVEPVAADSSAL
jgi:hypothetical protein